MAAAREAALGRLAADVAHDLANPLFGVLGLVDLLLADAEPGSKAEERLRLIRQTGLELKAGLRELLDLARAEPGDEGADLVEAVRKALRLARRRERTMLERLPAEPVVVACPGALVAQAALHLVAGADVVEVAPEGVLRVEPVALDALARVAVARIAADHGGAYTDGELRLPLAEG